MRMAITQFLRDVEALSYPEYRARHLFTAKLRLIVFLGFIFLYVVSLKNELSNVTGVTATIAIAFFCTVLAYYLIIARGKVVIAMVIEALADVVSLTAIVYLTGGAYSIYFMLYVLYCLTAGAFYNFRIALVTAIISYAAYLAMIFALWSGGLEELAVSFSAGRHFTYGPQSNPWVNPLLLGLFLIMAVYVTRIAHSFTQRRERMLEEKNRELAALHKMSSTIRSATPLAEVADRVLSSMLSGLDFSLCLLMIMDKKTGRLICYPPRKHPLTRKSENILGFSLGQLTVAVERVKASDTVQFHRNFYEMTDGLEPFISREVADEVQKALGLQVMVMLPLVVDTEIIGTCIGMTTAPLIEDHQLATLEVFANQAALLIQTATLIEELKTKNQELITANRVKSEFLATMSHELRTPLTAIIGFSELLLEGVMGELNTEQRDSLREVLNNGTSLLDLINNLLDFVKVESGKMGLHPQAFSLQDLVERLRRSLWPLIQRKRQEFHADVSEDLPPITADEKRLQQVVLNLFSNAIKFTPEDGKLNVTVRRAEHYDQLSPDIRRRFTAIASPQAAYYVISVADSGIGIAPENLEKVFEMFKQIDSSVSRSYEGTGLGLALAKQLVELHGGMIWAESELGSGATFICVIPSPA